MHLRTSTQGRRIVEDYALPDALCVPVWRFDIRDTLERIAHAASSHLGVIVIGPDPEILQDCIARAPRPDHCAMVTGAFDSPWLRDHAPIAVRASEIIEFVRPRRGADHRRNDTVLFETIFRTRGSYTDHVLASGNVIAGPDGLAVSTTAVLADNGLSDPGPLSRDAARLGIRDWVFVPPFPDDISRHSDCMLRFLAPDLCAVLMRLDSAGASDVSYEMVERMKALRPDIKILPLTPIASGGAFDSPINWIQIGRHLLVPDFGLGVGLTGKAAQLLTRHGFEIVPIAAGTSRMGGALRCLTASVFAN